MNKELKLFVQQWMDGHEEDTFIKNEHGNVIYSAGPTSLNLTAFFVNLLEDYQEKVINPKMISVEAVKEWVDTQSKVYKAIPIDQLLTFLNTHTNVK